MDWIIIFKGIWALVLFSLPKVLLFSFGMFLISIILMIVLKKRGLLQRKNKYWNWATKIYYVYIPIVLVCFGIACGCLSSTKSYLDQRHKEFLGPVSEAVVHGVVAYLSDKVAIEEIYEKGVAIQEFVTHIFGNFQYQPKSDGFIENFKADVSEKIIARGAKWVLGMAIKKALENISARLHLGLEFQNDVVKLGKKITDDLNFKSIDDKLPDILTAAVHSNIQEQLSYIYYAFIQTALMFLALPFIEILIYTQWVRKKYDHL